MFLSNLSDQDLSFYVGNAAIGGFFRWMGTPLHQKFNPSIGEHFPTSHEYHAAFLETTGRCFTPSKHRQSRSIAGVFDFGEKDSLGSGGELQQTSLSISAKTSPFPPCFFPVAVNLWSCRMTAPVSHVMV